ncbi:hypothetical protein N7G274_009781 [Stereocaulon virgatum]|uniref:Uncharacterized protein n=1 Tax=Stereocaulon virgatum TaxID=373712 RepID=A0ABR3ZXL1_9LECA
MAKERHYNPISGLESSILFKLCVYYIYVTDESDEDHKQVASAFMKNHAGIFGKKRQATATYQHLHDTKHASWVKAKDLNIERPEQLRSILRDEMHLPPERWDRPIILPVAPTAQLRSPVEKPAGQ